MGQRPNVRAELSNSENETWVKTLVTWISQDTKSTNNREKHSQDDKDEHRNGHRPEETKEIWQLSEMWDPGLDPWTKRVDINGKFGEIQIKSGVELIK